MSWVVDTDVQNIPRNVCLTLGSCYTKIPGIRLSLHRKGAEISDIPDCHTSSIPTLLLTDNITYLPILNAGFSL